MFNFFKKKETDSYLELSKIVKKYSDFDMFDLSINNKEYIEMQKEIKFEDLIHFGRKIKRIRKDINNNIKLCSKDSSKIRDKTCIISIVLYLIDRCNFRVGNEKYKKLYNSYGATTLNRRHFTLNKNNILIKFNGKKGVENESKVENKNVKNLMKYIHHRN